MHVWKTQSSGVGAGVVGWGVGGVILNHLWSPCGTCPLWMLMSLFYGIAMLSFQILRSQSKNWKEIGHLYLISNWKLDLVAIIAPHTSCLACHEMSKQHWGERAYLVNISKAQSVSLHAMHHEYLRIDIMQLCYFHFIIVAVILYAI